MEILLYAEIYLICIIIMGLIIFWTKRGEDSSLTGIWFKAVLICFLINFAANFLFTLCRPQIAASGVVRNLAFLLKTIYHISLICGVYTWCCYTAAELGVGVLFNKRNMRILIIAMLIPVLFAIINLWTGLLFVLNGKGGYERGIAFHLQMVLLIATSAVFSIRVLKRGHSEPDPMRSSHLKLLSSFPLCLLAAWILSFIGESVPVICVSITIEILCLYIGFSNQRISMDKLTQVNNRQNLIAYIDYKIANHEDQVYVLFIDMDRFKLINDTYGHLEGDKALIRVAKALKICCGPVEKRPYIARYGGDEFIIIMETSDRVKVDSLCEAIREKTAELNKEAEAPYELRLTIGVSEFQEGMGHNDLIASADQKLYEQRKNRR